VGSRVQPASINSSQASACPTARLNSGEQTGSPLDLIDVPASSTRDLVTKRPIYIKPEPPAPRPRIRGLLAKLA